MFRLIAVVSIATVIVALSLLYIFPILMTRECPQADWCPPIVTCPPIVECPPSDYWGTEQPDINPEIPFVPTLPIGKTSVFQSCFKSATWRRVEFTVSKDFDFLTFSDCYDHAIGATYCFLSGVGNWNPPLGQQIVICYCTWS